MRRSLCGWLSSALVSLATLVPSSAAEPAEQYEPAVAAASDDAQRAIGSFRVPQGLKVELVAAEPQLANPVAFTLDRRGRIFVAETFRQKHGVEDNREHLDWLDDDLAANTVEDRLAYFQKRLGQRLAEYGREHDRIRALVDRDGDGRFEHSVVFADGFHGPLEGTGAGLLVRGGDLFYTCIPHLWRLRDQNGDLVADERASLQSGYGVRVAFRGHDLHGLCLGPDGKLYFSMGDRGFNVHSGGRQLAYPDRGAVLRCNPDGSELEVVHQGLRNPQELAFDKFGNLFTCDNNCDGGDRARWVYVVEGGDSGWRMSYQYLPDRGPWNRERLWEPAFARQAAYIVPPIANVSDGPSGLAYFPGVGPERFRDQFFLCDFRGTNVASGVRAVAVEPAGAGFELADDEQLVWSILATDVEFGPDGSMYVLDWVEGWDGSGKGRIYRVFDPALKDDPQVAATARLLREGAAQRSVDELVALLGHADQRVRLEAQLALAERGEPAIRPLAAAAARGEDPLPRLHALWGLGQLGRTLPAARAAAAALLGDPHGEVRAQAAKVVGDCAHQPAVQRLVELLRDDEARVRFFAAQSLGKLRAKEALPALVELLRANDDADAYLRHAAVQALEKCGDQATLLAAAGDRSPAVRLGCLLALRSSPHVEKFLHDEQPWIVEEAARAIYDLPNRSCRGQLAKLASGDHKLTEPALLRAVAAHRYDDGSAIARCDILGRIAADDRQPTAARTLALQILRDWTRPSGRDPLLGDWRPVPPGRGEEVVAALRPVFPALLAAAGPLRLQTVELLSKYKLTEAAPALVRLAGDRDAPGDDRAAALAALDELASRELAGVAQGVVHDESPVVRAAAQRVLARLRPEEAVKLLGQALAEGSLQERQSALALLGEARDPAADRLLEDWLDRLLAGKVPDDVQLDLLAAAERRGQPALKERLARFEAARRKNDPLAPYREAMAGGDARRGRRLFLERSDLSCLRCHKIKQKGGEVGPDLTKVGLDKTREYLLQALVDPSAVIAQGYESAILALADGRVVTGVVRGEDEKELRLVSGTGQLFTIAKSDIEQRARGKSAMPDDLAPKLTKRELRDLVEFLAGLQEE